MAWWSDLLAKSKDDWVGALKNEAKAKANSSQAINGWENGKAVTMRASGFLGGGAATLHNIKNVGMSPVDAAKAGHSKIGADGKEVLNYAPIAGSFIAAGAAYRVASGGGVYRDANGNTDVAGIPFI